MMKRYLFINSFWLTALLFLNFADGYSQALPCGKVRIDTNAVSTAISFERNSAGQRIATVNYLVRVYFHIGRYTNGTNPALTLTQMASEFNNLLTIYAPDNVCFLNAGYDYINNTSLDTNFNADNDNTGAAFNSYQVPGCINIFYLGQIKGNNTACNPPCGYGGIALGGIPGTFFLVAKGNIGQGSTISHEMGHNLGLLHTFEPYFGYEKIDGSNGSTAADKIADTKADPFAYNGNSCYSVNGCVYNGSCTDPNGATNFAPPYTNLMSYWWGTGCYPTQITTSGQFTRVNTFLNTYPALLNCSSPSSVTQGAITVSSGYFMRSAIDTYTTSGNVILNGTVESVLGGGTVILQPGFQAAPSIGLVQIKIKPCQ